MDPKIQIPDYEATPVASIPNICATVRATFSSNRTKDLEWRKIQLRKLYWALTDFTPKLVAALKKDLNKSEYEAYLTEIDWVKNDCTYLLKHLDSYAKDSKIGSPELSIAFAPTRMRYRKEPLGATLIIGTYNYPVMLLLAPFTGAIAAGCTAVLKPSESAPATAMAIKEMIEDRLDNSAFTVVNGMVGETGALLNEKWDKIFYTGGASVAKIIAKKAAETLTPVTLELGGQNPAFVTRHANVKLAARRMLWSKALNAGQVCLSQNYVLAEKPIVDDLVKAFNEAFEDFFPNGAKDSELVHVINERHFLRLKNMLDKTKGKIVMGGKMDQSTLFMEPTAVLVDSPEDITVQEESFGPIFAILPVDNLAQAIEIANEVYRTPLASFSFGSKEDHQTVLGHTTSGGTTLNDSFSHASFSNVSFGGVGESGMGSYRGKASFDCFTHQRVVADVPSWMEPFLRVRYMPYKWGELKRFRLLTSDSPDFDREGRVIKGLGYWLKFVLTLGASGTGGGGGSGAKALLLQSYHRQESATTGYTHPNSDGDNSTINRLPRRNRQKCMPMPTSILNLVLVHFHFHGEDAPKLTLTPSRPQNNPLHISIFPSYEPSGPNTPAAPLRTPLQFSLLLSSTLDVFELRARAAAQQDGGGGATRLSGDLGLLHAVDDRLAAYGFETNTGVKMVAVVDMRGRSSRAVTGPAVGAGGGGGGAAVGLREGEVKPVFKAMQAAYVQLLQNPFFDPDEHSPPGGRGGHRITSKKFGEAMRRIGENWAPGVTNL